MAILTAKLALVLLVAAGCSVEQPSLPLQVSGGDALVAEFLVHKSKPTIRLPLPRNFSYNFKVDWNDGTESHIDAHDHPEVSHTYDEMRSYRIVITGQVDAWSFWKVPHSKDQLISVENLGDVGWKNLAGAFYNCSALESVAGGGTAAVTDMSYAFHRSPSVLPDVGDWDTGSVKRMRAMFDGAVAADPDVRDWDTRSVVDMSGMFARTDEARPRVGNWDTASVVLMSNMFRGAKVANPDVRRWNTRNVTDMSSMFRDAPGANPNVQRWHTGKVVSMYEMFRNATSANPDMGRWSFANVRLMNNMFSGVVLPTATYTQMLIRAQATARHKNVTLHAGKKTRYAIDAIDARNALITEMGWKITDGGVDASSQAFSSRWEVRGNNLTIELPLVEGYDYNFRVKWGDGVESTVISGSDEDRMHTYAQPGVYTVVITGLMESWSFKKKPRSKDQLTNVWNLGTMGWKYLGGAFAGCNNLKTVAGGATGLVTDMSYMFHQATQVEVDIGNWNTRSVTNMQSMFDGATVASPDVSKWDVSKVRSMRDMFKDAARAEPDMSAWKFSSIENLAGLAGMAGMFSGVKLPTTHYDKMLLCICATAQSDGVVLDGGQSRYSKNAYNTQSDTEFPCNTDNACTTAGGELVTDAATAKGVLAARGWQITDGGHEHARQPLVTRWRLPYGGEVKLPLVQATGMSYALEVDWGDGARNSISGDSWKPESITHTYAAASDPSDPSTWPTVTISGSIGSGRWSCQAFRSEGRCAKLFAVDDLGDLKWKNLSGAFAFCNALTSFKGGYTTEVTDMSFMFQKSPRVRPKVMSFDVGRVRNMQGMFQEAFSANPDVSEWNVARVENLSWMFAKTRLANPDVSSWSVSRATDMSYMFYRASAADPDVSKWHTARLSNIESMFRRADRAKPEVSSWDTAQVRNMAGVFRRAARANPNVSGWNTARVTDMSYAFAETRVANPAVASWNTGSVTSMKGMFFKAKVADPNVSNWDTGQVTDLSRMFYAAQVADPDVSEWETHRATNMRAMFRDAPQANPDVSSWYVAKVTDMAQMFMNAGRAEPDVSNWNVAKVADMSSMFMGATRVGNSLDASNWNFTRVTNMAEMFKNVTLPTAVYSDLLIRIGQTATKKSVTLHGGASKYTAQAAKARSRLVNDRGWEITDGGLE